MTGRRVETRGRRALVRRLIALALPLALAAGGLTVAATVDVVTADRASAASTAGFEAGNIIDDSTFYNTSTMSAADIQSFLASKVVNCSSGYTCLKDYKQTTTSRSADSYCSGYTGRSGETAATILSRVGQSCGINPQVLLVMLQKEQGLVLSTAPSASRYTIALGYACPDTAACDTKYYGFFNQLYSAARQLQVYADNPTYFRYRAGFNNVIQYNPSAACGTKTVYIENKATASLYNYTPYTPNAAALAAGFGSATCGAYGNRNFYLYFTDWFGAPSNWIQSASFEGGTVAGWTRTTGSAAANWSLRKDAASAHAGNYYLRTNTAKAGALVSQSVARATKVGEQATATIWLRSDSATPFTGTVILRSVGGTAESITVPFSVGQTWTQVSATLPMRVSAHSGVRLDVSLASLKAATLMVDDANLAFGAAPALKNRLLNPSFEAGTKMTSWGAGTVGAIASSGHKSTGARTGSYFGAANTAVTGRSFAQTVTANATVGETWTARVWVRSSSATPFSGRLTLWGLGGSARLNTSANFTAGSTWTEVTATLPLGTVDPATFKVELYLNTVKSQATLWMDDASLSPDLLTAGSFENSTTGWARSLSTMNLAVYSKASSGVAPKTGSYFAASNTPVAGNSISQTATTSPSVGDTYRAAVWLRSQKGTFDGRFALWALGGTTEVASTSFTVGTAWTKVELELPIKLAGHTQVKFEVYEDTNMKTSTLWVDGATLD